MSWQLGLKAVFGGGFIFVQYRFVYIQFIDFSLRVGYIITVGSYLTFSEGRNL